MCIPLCINITLPVYVLLSCSRFFDTIFHQYATYTYLCSSVYNICSSIAPLSIQSMLVSSSAYKALSQSMPTQTSSLNQSYAADCMLITTDII